LANSGQFDSNFGAIQGEQRTLSDLDGLDRPSPPTLPWSNFGVVPSYFNEFSARVLEKMKKA
jgi:hypothetical protein